MKVVLEGFMGVGKTTVGKVLAEKLNWTFTDTDEEVEKQAGKTIQEMLSEGEESLFRNWEKKICLEMAKKDNAVISTGGGVFMNEDNAEILSKDSFVVCLERSLEEIYPMISGDPNRRLAYGKTWEEMERLLEIRRPNYRRYANLILENKGNLQEITDKIISQLIILSEFF